MFPEHIFSENHICAAIFEDLECDWYCQAGGEGPGRVHLADRFLESAVCELQEAPIFASLVDLETVRFGIAESRALVAPSKEGVQGDTYSRFMTFRSAPVSRIAETG